MVAMPLSRCRMLRITRSQESRTRALWRITAMAWPLCRRTPSKISPWLMTSLNAGIVANHGNGLAFVQAHTIKDFAVANDFRVADGVLIQALIDLKNPGNRAHAGENTVLFGQNCGCGALLTVNAGARGNVAGGFVFQQTVFEKITNSAAVPVHVLCF